MTKLDTSTAAVNAALNGVTDGPWETVDEFRDDLAVNHIWIGPKNWKTRIGRVVEYTGYENEMRANAQFIAAARELVPALLMERDDLKLAVRHAVDHADCAIEDRTMLMDALDGMLIALSTGKGIAEATDNAKAAMRRATQGDAQ